MRRRLLVDTGPLVALLDRRDHFHEWADAFFRPIDHPLFSCEPVLTEACFLLQTVQGANQALLEWVTRRLIISPFRLDHQARSIKDLMSRYANIPMSLADACLVRMAELDPQGVVVTLDSDFRMYRKNRRQVIPTIMPDR